MAVIYRAMCKSTGKSYVGQTTGFERRKRQHIARYAKHTHICPKFYYAMLKYGHEDFVWEILRDGNMTLSQLNKWEKYWIKKLNTVKRGYNVLLGGSLTNSGKDSPKWKGGRKKATQRYATKNAALIKMKRTKENHRTLDKKDFDIFLQFIKKDNCWSWTGKHNQRNQPVFKKKRAKLVIYKIYNNRNLDRESFIKTNCGNENCLNPSHFIIVNRAGLNYQRGEKAHSSKLSGKDVLKIIHLHDNGLKTNAQLARMYGVTPQNIHRIVKRKTWRSLDKI